MSHETQTTRPWMLPALIGVALLCVVEAVVIAYLIGRGRGGVTGGGGPTAAHEASPVPAEASPPPAPAASERAAAAAPSGPDVPQRPAPGPGHGPAAGGGAGPAVVRGKVGERVESGGLALTVAGVTDEPAYKEINTPPPTQKFVGVELVLENNSGQDHRYFGVNFTLKDDRDRAYTARILGAHEPALEHGTIVTGEKLRGHLAFVVPKEATGLTLVYGSNTAPARYRPIHIDLGH